MKKLFTSLSFFVIILLTSIASFATEWNLWEVSKDLKESTNEFHLFATYKDLKTCERFRNHYLNEMKMMWRSISSVSGNNSDELEVIELSNKIILKYKPTGKEIEERFFCATTVLNPNFYRKEERSRPLDGEEE